MAVDFIKIAITPAEPRTDESSRIECLLRSGWDKVHLRHPNLDTRGVRAIIEGIDQRLHSRLVLHGHFDLINEFNLGGLHLNHRCPVPPALYRGSLSRSCHTVAEVVTAASSGLYNYVTLSPVLSSVSKSGYEPSLSVEEFREAIAASSPLPVIALGGVTPEVVPAIRRIGFGGIAVLGYLDAADTLYELNERSKEFTI